MSLIKTLTEKFKTDDCDLNRNPKIKINSRLVKNKSEIRCLGEYQVIISDKNQKFILKQNTFTNKKEAEEFIKILKFKESLNDINLLNLKDYSTFVNKGFCNTFYKIEGYYSYYENTLEKEIIRRSNENSYYSLKEINFMIVQSIKCLKYLHENNVYHGNIDPSGLFINDDFEIKLIDNIEKIDNIIEIQRNNLTLYNKSIYMSPEIFYNIIQRKKDFDFDNYKSDTYSLGLIFLEAAIMKPIQAIYEDNKDGLINQEKLNEYLVEVHQKYGNDSLIYIILEKLLIINENERYCPSGILDYISENLDFLNINEIIIDKSIIISKSSVNSEEKEYVDKFNKDFQNEIESKNLENKNIRTENYNLEYEKYEEEMKLKKISSEKETDYPSLDVKSYLSQYFPNYNGNIKVNRYKIDKNGNKILIDDVKTYFNESQTFGTNENSTQKLVSIKKYMILEDGTKKLIELGDFEKSETNNNSYLSKEAYNNNIIRENYENNNNIDQDIEQDINQEIDQNINNSIIESNKAIQNDSKIENNLVCIINQTGENEKKNKKKKKKSKENAEDIQEENEDIGNKLEPQENDGKKKNKKNKKKNKKKKASIVNEENI